MRRVWIEINYTWDKDKFDKSPSMRRVWIEISGGSAHCFPFPVTLHAEGVD